MKQLSVIIPSYRNPTYLDLCLKSAFENQNHDNQIIVVLDGYIEESQEVINKYPGLDVVEFEENKGQMVAHNTGVTLAENEYILIVNDDNVFPKNWDSRLMKHVAFNFDGYRGVYSPNQIEPTPSTFGSFIHKDFGQKPSDFRYEDFLNFEQEKTEIYRQTEHNDITFRSNPKTPDGQTWPLFMMKRWYMTLGGIDQNYPSAAVADWDFFLRCELAGLQCHRDMSINFYHFAGAATRKIDSSWNEGEQRSFEYFYHKWGYIPTMNNRTHSKFPTEEVVRGVRFK